jgi:hypothetical protein
VRLESQTESIGDAETEKWAKVINAWRIILGRLVRDADFRSKATLDQ